jgi:hypothetical protein
VRAHRSEIGPMREVLRRKRFIEDSSLRAKIAMKNNELGNKNEERIEP